jgi:anti-sigma regulatory factor (Ser/Thr protein kinase)
VTGDEISLTLPRERSYYPIAELVLGGLAARRDVTLEQLEDLELALQELLDRVDGEGPATVRFHVDDDALRATIGPYGDRLRDELEDSERAIGLRRLLDTVVDRYEVREAEGAHWVELAKVVA